MGAWKGKLLSVEDNPTKEGKPRWKVMIDTDDMGLTEFTLWDAGLVGQGEDAVDMREWVGQRLMFDAKKGGKKKDRDGNELDERWPSTLSLVKLDGAVPPIEPASDLLSVLQSVVDGCDALAKVVDGVKDRAVNALAMASDST